MRIHHLNCGTMRPPGGALVSGRKPDGSCACLVCHVTVVELGDRLVLIDSGLGLEDVRDPRRRLGRGFQFGARPILNEAETAVRQIEALGFEAADVRDVILTHMDLDHAGGLSDFPGARVHVHADEWAQASGAKHPRYSPPQWAHLSSEQVRTYSASGAEWNGFPCVRELDGLPSEVLLVPLAGHSVGHVGVAIDRGEMSELHAGDAYFHRGSVRADVQAPKLLAGCHRLMAADAGLAGQNIERLAELYAREVPGLAIYSAHDEVELEETLGLGSST